ncbi:3-phosphoshikimate 1-carboxyvinyltransferase [Fusibacter ferrireducens]|uniref:3-phosphoshikimate 1-carboxyvinyltransferase n=1 Tax=Fusibacter ferrireducens TaxID=2785058 RepID=A0ABR9ZV86_9FIRM|nr:3-phosphoshikimate 1-carboxyvinyltransferase [Fusibacter ferrireducens]MBF4694281.1 3-phosphoshikimate 1-carboxyvinyltransferase [Fusibacter ferrireducens]
MQAKIKRSCLKGIIRVPGSKSHTIRAVLISTMAEGVSTIRNPLTSEDCLSALRVAKSFGAKCVVKEGQWEIEGTSGKLKLPDDVVDCGNSGTTTYIGTALAGTIEGTTIITGDEQIRSRPINKLLEALNQSKVTAYTTRPEVDAPPVVIQGKMEAGTITIEGKISPQVTGLLLASTLIEGKTTLNVTTPMETPYIDMTLDWMKKYGVAVEKNNDYSQYDIFGPQSYKAQDQTVASDWSGVLFPLVASIVTDSEVTIEGVDFNDLQGDKEIVNVLIKMGADITKDVEKGNIHIRGGKPLMGISIDLRNTPDALPILCIAAACAEGQTEFTGLEVVRLKETDRVAVMEEELLKMGVEVFSEGENLIVIGGKPFKSAIVDSHDDHRVAMALMVAGLTMSEQLIVKDIECSSVSYPNFIQSMNNLGASFEIIE